MGEVINGRAIERNYQVDGPGPIMLSIVIGDAQIGGSGVKLEDKLIGKGTINHFPIGTPAEVRGKKLNIRTVVADVNPNTNHTSVTYILTGGIDEADFTLLFDAPHDKDAVPYTAVFTFV